MKNDLKVVIGKIIIDSKVNDPKVIELISQVTTDYARLSARVLAGEDVAKELAVVDAITLSMEREQKRIIGNALSLWISTTLNAVLINLVTPD